METTNEEVRKTLLSEIQNRRDILRSYFNLIIGFVIAIALNFSFNIIEIGLVGLFLIVFILGTLILPFLFFSYFRFIELNEIEKLINYHAFYEDEFDYKEINKKVDDYLRSGVVRVLAEYGLTTLYVTSMLSVIILFIEFSGLLSLLPSPSPNELVLDILDVGGRIFLLTFSLLFLYVFNNMMVLIVWIHQTRMSLMKAEYYQEEIDRDKIFTVEKSWTTWIAYMMLQRTNKPNKEHPVVV